MHISLFTAFLINTHTTVSGTTAMQIPTQMYSLINFFPLHRRGEKKNLPILFVSFLIITFLCSPRFMSCQKTACKYVMAVPRHALRTVYTRLRVCTCCIQPGCDSLAKTQKPTSPPPPHVSLWTNFSGCIYKEEKCSLVDLCCVLFLSCQMQRKGRAEFLKSSQGRVHVVWVWCLQQRSTK